MTDEELLEKIRWSINFPRENCDSKDNDSLHKALEFAIGLLSCEGGCHRECGNIEPTQRRERCWRSWGHNGNCAAGQWTHWDPTHSATHMLHHDTKRKQAEAFFERNQGRLTELKKLELEAEEHRKYLGC